MTRTGMLGELVVLCAVLTACGDDEGDDAQPGPGVPTGGSSAAAGHPELICCPE